ncbi:MAG: hypothetical protein J6L75_04780 [Alistipes sp.]|nr:hypothetical protein [Alistipes sp.]
MSNVIVNPKTYTGSELEKIFFRPILSGPTAEELGIRVLYNMPVPTILPVVTHSGNVLSSLDSSSSWVGNRKSTIQKEIKLERVKAENAFSASDYFTTIFELISNQSGLNMEDLSGTQLEQAETELFRKAIAESIRMNMWLGDKGNTLSTGYSSFDGLLKKVREKTHSDYFYYSDDDLETSFTGNITELFEKMIAEASPKLKGLFHEGQVAFFVSPDLYKLYQDHLDSEFGTAAYADVQNGRKALMYKGFSVIEVNLEPMISSSKISDQFIIFTDRRNLVLAVNTADVPGSEIRMWYNPDEMENRQRAVFAIGCEILDNELVCAATNYIP